MCLPKTPSRPTIQQPQVIAQPNNSEAERMADEETRARRRRSAAASILTGPRGIPAGTTSQLGAPT